MVLAGCLPWEVFPAIGYVGWGNSEIYWVGLGESEIDAWGSGGQWFVWVFVILCEFLRMKCGFLARKSESGGHRAIEMWL